MAGIQVKRFNAPDEARKFPHGNVALLQFGSDTVGLATFEPGWKWSKDVMPIAGTSSCKAAHSLYVLSGRMHTVMDDGETVDVGPGDFATIAPGHDAWVLGDEPCRMLDFTGMEHYAQPGAGAARGANAPRPEARPH
ncbi:cupin domain-containing protein [Aggregicoccus sp. 17bor-14]|uniref:cupin domain-containing protein n=1 Tax=Myxococcaceae TaxID=31 RepID=UPI00129D085A|nr:MULTISPECIES: cupin domain-containing protein [Myxococcaceae]MBF5042183.1 cupin domain-containing protein [Simulacricoccus sp. 17bor-14]MRI87960.1 cupin domain-containing protein [Aggregicoccus sp. 17bor-14]